MEFIVYRSEDGKLPAFDIVRSVKKRISEDMSLGQEYLPELGLEAFTRSATDLLLGDESYTVLHGLVGLQQIII